MRTRRFPVLAAGLSVLALVATACGGGSSSSSSGSKGTVTIGAFNFSESNILANVYGDALRAQGYTVNVRPNLGSREIVEPALEQGQIDMYPGYAATELEFINKGAGEATPDATQTVNKLNSHLDPKGLVALTPSPAVDQNAFAVTKATADKYHLTSIADLANKP
jgi:osmoprotectant transport system substrate-binding protein